MNIPDVEDRLNSQATTARDLYIDLLKKCLTRLLFDEKYRTVPIRRKLEKAALAPIQKLLGLRRFRIEKYAPLVPDDVYRGHGGMPDGAETMIGMLRIDNLQECVVDVLENDVPGDLIETGVWRGGSTIFMRALLKVYGDTERIVWVADSFQGLPKPNDETYPADAGSRFWRKESLRISEEQVRNNFRRYGLLDKQVRFLAGWFSETLPNAPIEKLSILLLDGNMYESTMDALRALYPKLSVGGYIIVDDYAIPACRKAVDDYRREHRVAEPIETIDWTGAYWQRER